MPKFLTVYLSELARLTFPTCEQDHNFLWKRAFDLALGLALVLPVGALIMILALWLRCFQGGPVFFISERMGRNRVPFWMIKFRTMDMAMDEGVATGGDKLGRITQAGRWMRRHRLDELPQLWNILRGEMSFVGPRPPLRRYTDHHWIIYDQLLRDRPGLTGLATILYSRREAAILAHTGSQHETDTLYSAVCVPCKARLDRFYQARAHLGLDLQILWWTFTRRR